MKGRPGPRGSWIGPWPRSAPPKAQRPPNVLPEEWARAKRGSRQSIAYWARIGKERSAARRARRTATKEAREGIAANLPENWKNLFRNMVGNKIPPAKALSYVERMRKIQDRYIPSKRTDKQWERFQKAYDDWYDELIDEYGYDIDELYPREE